MSSTARSSVTSAATAAAFPPAPTMPATVVGDSAGVVGVVVEGDRCPGGGECDGDGGPDRSARTGDHRCAPGERRVDLRISKRVSVQAEREAERDGRSVALAVPGVVAGLVRGERHGHGGGNHIDRLHDAPTRCDSSTPATACTVSSTRSSSWALDTNQVPRASAPHAALEQRGGHRHVASPVGALRRPVVPRVAVVERDVERAGEPGRARRHAGVVPHPGEALVQALPGPPHAGDPRPPWRIALSAATVAAMAGPPGRCTCRRAPPCAWRTASSDRRARPDECGDRKTRWRPPCRTSPGRA